MKYRPGDKVKCKVADEYLKEGQTYTVESVEPIWLKLKESEHWWLANRFEKVRVRKDNATP